MSSTRSLLVLAALATLHCGGGASPEPAPVSATDTAGDTAPETPTPVMEHSDQVVVLSAFTLREASGTAAHVSAEGTMTVNGEVGPTMRSTGQITMEGELIGIMTPDGHLTLQGQPIGVVATDGSVTVGEHQLSFGPDGRLLGGNPSGPQMILEPADSPSKRAAMAFLLLLTM